MTPRRRGPTHSFLRAMLILFLLLFFFVSFFFSAVKGAVALSAGAVLQSPAADSSSRGLGRLPALGPSTGPRTFQQRRRRTKDILIFRWRCLAPAEAGSGAPADGHKSRDHSAGQTRPFAAPLAAPATRSASDSFSPNAARFAVLSLPPAPSLIVHLFSIRPSNADFFSFFLLFFSPDVLFSSLTYCAAGPSRRVPPFVNGRADCDFYPFRG